MDSILTFSDINNSESKKVGLTATKMAELYRKNGNIELGFVLSSNLLEDFLTSNNILQHVKSSISSSDKKNTSNLLEIQESLKKMISKSIFSKELREAIVDAYDGLSVDSKNVGAESLIKTTERPFINVFSSLNYAQTFTKTGIVTNVKGSTQLFKAIKEVIIGYYSPESIRFRHEQNIPQDFEGGIIIQKMSSIDKSGYAVSYNLENFDDSKLFVAAEEGLGGLIDSGIDQDEYIIDRHNLAIIDERIAFKDSKLIKNSITGMVERKKLKSAAGNPVLNHKNVEEIARLIKIVSKNNPVSLFWYIYRDKIFCQRIVGLFKGSSKPIIETTKIEENTFNEEEQKIEKDIGDESEDFDAEVNMGIDEDKIELEEDLRILDDIEAEKFGFETETNNVESETKKIVETSKKPLANSEESIFSSIIEEKKQASPEIKISSEDKFLKRASDSAIPSIIFLHTAIIEKLKRLYKQFYGAESTREDLPYLIDSVNEQQKINNIESLKKVEDYKEQYLRGEKISLKQLAKTIEVTLSFLD